MLASLPIAAAIVVATAILELMRVHLTGGGATPIASGNLALIHYAVLAVLYVARRFPSVGYFIAGCLRLGLIDFRASRIRLVTHVFFRVLDLI